MEEKSELELMIAQWANNVKTVSHVEPTGEFEMMVLIREPRPIFKWLRFIPERFRPSWFYRIGSAKKYTGCYPISCSNQIKGEDINIKPNVKPEGEEVVGDRREREIDCTDTRHLVRDGLDPTNMRIKRSIEKTKELERQRMIEEGRDYDHVMEMMQREEDRDRQRGRDDFDRSR